MIASQFLTSLVGPAVVAAAISSWVVWLTTNRRFELDRELAERKIAADIDLAERKFAFDRALVTWRRRVELAEQALTNVYEARNVFVWARSRGILDGEGETRPKSDGESDELESRRNTYFIPIERLAREKQIFATLQTTRPAIEAYFGIDATKPIVEIAKVHAEINAAAGILILMAEGELICPDEGNVSLRNTLGWGPRSRPDEIDARLDEAVRAMEAVCQPALSWKPDA